MAPPPGIVEVRCAGCGETLEVEPGLTEFACPDCGTHQALPPELMPRRPRRALPLPGRCALLPSAQSRVACWGCGAVLSAPHGHGRFACPLCSSELAAPPAAAVTVVAAPAAVPITPSRLLQPSEVRPGTSSQPTHVGHVQQPIHSEQTHGQHPRHSFREDPFTSSRADTRTEIPVVGRLQNEPAKSLSHREESHIESLETISRPIKKKSRFLAGPDSYPARRVQGEHPNQAVYASEPQGMPSKSSVHTDKVEDRLPNGTVTVHSKQKVGNVVVPSIIEQEQTRSLAVDEQQKGEIPNTMVNADKMHVDFASEAGKGKKSTKESRGNQKRKCKLSMNSSNELPYLRHIRCLVKGSHDPVDVDPIERIDASPNQNLSEIEITLADSDPSSPARHQLPHVVSNEWDGVDASATTPPALNHGTQQNSQLQNQDRDGQLEQEACSGKNRLGQLRFKPRNENLSEHGRQKRNGFPGSSSNGGAQPEDWSFSGTYHQNLSASCSRLAASLPFPDATTLPTIQSPPSCENNRFNCCSPTLLRQQPPSPLYSQDAPCGDVLPRSISNSSKKRRGRAPGKLMEPRKEAERPVLTPSGTDWNVHPPCPKVASTLSVLIKQNYSGIYVSDDTSGNGEYCEHVVYHWHQCPPDTRATIMDEFLKRYKWSPGHEEECQKIFDRKAVRNLVNLFCYEKQRVRQLLATKKARKSSSVHKACGEMELEEDDGREDPDEQQQDESLAILKHEDPLTWKPFVPVWMKPKWWEMLCDHWAKDEVMKMSYQQRKNRYSGKHLSNTAGSPKIAHEQAVGTDNSAKLVIDIDSHSPTKVLRESDDQRACQTEDTRDQPNKETQCTQLGSNSVERQVGSGKCRRYCGAIGVSKKTQHEALSKSSPVCVSKQGQQPMFTIEQVQEMVNQALQGLNEVWEKKFLSLEQKIPSISSSHIVPDGVKEASLAVRGSKRCKLAVQDSLGSMDGGDDPSEGDDHDYQVEDDEEYSG